MGRLWINLNLRHDYIAINGCLSGFATKIRVYSSRYALVFNGGGNAAVQTQTTTTCGHLSSPNPTYLFHRAVTPRYRRYSIHAKCQRSGPSCRMKRVGYVSFCFITQNKLEMAEYGESRFVSSAFCLNDESLFAASKGSAFLVGTLRYCIGHVRDTWHMPFLCLKMPGVYG